MFQSISTKFSVLFLIAFISLSGELSAQLSFTSDDVCFGQTSLFEGNADTINYLEIQWDFGDPSTTADTDTGGVVSYTYPNPGIYAVVIKGINILGQVAETDTINISVNALPDFELVSFIKVCSPTYTIDTELNSTDFNFIWSNNATTPSITVNSSGIYKVTVTDASTGCFSIDSIAVEFTPNPVIANAGQDVSFCPPSFGRIGGPDSSKIAGTGVGPFTYQWEPSGRLNFDTIPNPFVGGGPTEVFTLTITDSRGCVSKDQVVVFGQPIADAGPDLKLCLGDSIQIGGDPSARSGDGNYTYSWEPAALVSDPTIANPFAFPNQPLSFTLTITDGTGCEDVDIVVIDAQNKRLNVNAGNFPADVCDSSTVILGGNGLDSTATGNTGPYSYLWQPTENLISDSTISNPVALITEEITYTVFVVDSYGCEDSATVDITIKPERGPKLLYPDTSFCLGDQIKLGGEGTIEGDTIGTDFRWLPKNAVTNDEVSDPFTIINTTTTFTLEATYQSNCISSTVFTVEVLPLPELDVITLKDTYCEDDENDTIVLFPIMGDISGPGIEVLEGDDVRSSFSIIEKEAFSTTVNYPIDVQGLQGGELCKEAQLDSVCFYFDNERAIGDIIFSLEKDGLELELFNIISDNPRCASDSGRFCIIPGTNNSPLGQCPDPFSGNFTATGGDLDTFNKVGVNANGTWNFATVDSNNAVTNAFRFDTITIHFSQNKAVFKPAEAINATTVNDRIVDILYTGYTKDSCSVDTLIQITVNPSPNVTLPADTFICRGNLIDISDFGTYASDGTPYNDPNRLPYDYAWNEEVDEAVRMDQFPSIIDIDTTTTFMVTITDSLGCKGSGEVIAKVFRVDVGPVDMACLDVPRQIGDMAGFNGAKTPASVLLRWSSNKLQFTTPVNNAQVTYQPTTPGEHILELYGEYDLFDTLTCKDSTDLLLEVNENPNSITTDLVQDNDTIRICEGETFTFGSADNDCINCVYFWDAVPPVGDINLPAGDIPADFRDSFRFDLEPVIDTFRYELLVQDTITGCDKRDTLVLVVWPKPEVDIQVDGASIDTITQFCLGNTETLVGNITLAPGVNFQTGSPEWLGNPIGYLSDANSATTDLTPLDAGVFTYILEAIDERGCKGSDTIVADVRAAPLALVDDVSFCEGEETSVFANETSGATGVTYAWSADPGLTIVSGSTTPTVVITSNVPGTYNLTVTVSNGGCDNTTTAIVTVFEGPEISFEGAGFIFLCEGEPGEDFTSFTFEPGDFNENPGDAPIVSYQWEPQGDVINSDQLGATVLSGSAESAIYTLIVTDANGCSAENLPQKPISVNVIKKPIPNLRMDTFTCPDYYFVPGNLPYVANLGDIQQTFLANPPGTYTYNDGRGTIISGTLDPSEPDSFLFLGATEYNLEITLISSGNPTERGYAECTNSASNLIQPGCEIALNMPNVFTPEDTDNNNFGLKYRGKDFYLNIDEETFSMVIYDRWGKEVYKTSNINDSWDGTLMNKGEKLPPATYTWVITGIFKTKEPINGSGSVTLIR